MLDVGGIDVRAVKLDSGAAKVECFLPVPRGIVPFEVSGGVMGVTIHRPAGTPVAADSSTGAVQVNLDAQVRVAPPAELAPVAEATGKLANALEILLDGVESRIRSRR